MDFSFPRYEISEVNINKVDYRIPTSEMEDLRTASLEQIRHWILFPTQVPEAWTNLKMLSKDGELYPAHLPSLADPVGLPLPTRVLFFWNLENLAPCTGNLVLPKELAVLLDPPVLNPKVRDFFYLDNQQVAFLTLSCASPAYLFRTAKCQKWMNMEIGWEQEGVEEGVNQIALSLELKNLEFLDILSMRCRKSPFVPRRAGQGPLPPPLLDSNMSFLYWNARGIARPKFIPHVLTIIQQHNPHLLVISEIGVGKENAEAIIAKLPFDKSVVVAANGFSGGIMILWKSTALAFEPTRMNNQGIHGLI